MVLVCFESKLLLDIIKSESALSVNDMLLKLNFELSIGKQLNEQFFGLI